MAEHTIQIRFESPAALREEYEKNIANRGIFVATEEVFEVREKIDVDVVLSYVDDTHAVLSLVGEIVHRVPAELAASGATPGIAVQFDDSARELQEAFSSLLDEPPPTPDKDTTGEQRRTSKRGTVRVPVRVAPATSPPFETTSRDLSATGILLALNRKHALPIGEVVRICLWHPSGEPVVEIDGQVVREVKNRSGRVAAIAVAFDRGQASTPEAGGVIEALRQAGHRSRLGGIEGSVADLGLPSLLRMFGNTAPQGTLVVENDGEQGWIAFAKGQLLGAALGALVDHDALVVMLGWKVGRFQFEPTVDSQAVARATPVALDEAVAAASGGVDGGSSARAIVVDDAAVFDIDPEQERIARSSLDKTAEAVLELAGTGISAKRLKSIIPEPADKVQATLEDLVELGVLVPR